MYAYKQQQTADISLQKNSKRHILRWFGDHILFLARKMLQPTSFIGNIERPSMLKVAVISSSLDHVKRGVETWAKDLGYALKEKGVRVTLYKGSGKINGNFETVIPCLRCGSGVSKAIQRILPPFRWHLGFGSEFQAQQTTFTLNLIPELLIRNFDIVHTQDPDVANIIRVLNKVGLIKAKVILAHGTEEPSEFIRKFDYLQHLAPFHMQEAIAQGINGSKHFAIPNFVDTDKFRPEVKSDLRKELGIPEDAFVVLSVAAIKKVHKRIDYLINSINILNNNKVYLVIAGAKSAETEALIELGKKKLGDRAIFLTDFPRERMNEVYVTADVFVLCSLFEMFGIVFLEAMSSSVPVLGHTHPVFRWIIGEGGECIDMAKEGELAKTIEKYMDESYRKEKGQKARERAVKDFSKDVVVDKIIEMYKEVLECSH
jgi:glycosyltransferase involved in cell wall biosynthesis